MDIVNLTRFCIPNLKQELIENLVPMGRHSEIINFHEKYLNDDQYYCLSPYNPVKPKGLHWIYGPSTRHYVCGGVSQYFVASSIEIEGVIFNAIIQKIYPRKAIDFYKIDENTVVYLSKNEVDKFIKYGRF